MLYPPTICCAATFSHDAADGLASIADGRLVGEVRTPLWSYGYTLDGLGQVGAVNDPVQPGAVQHTYGRNALDQADRGRAGRKWLGEHQLGLRQRLPHHHAGGQRHGHGQHLHARRGGGTDRAGDQGGHHHHPEPHAQLQRGRGADGAERQRRRQQRDVRLRPGRSADELRERGHHGGVCLRRRRAAGGEDGGRHRQRADLGRGGGAADAAPGRGDALHLVQEAAWGSNGVSWYGCVTFESTGRHQG